MQQGAASGAVDPRGFSPDQYTDIRYDDDYEKFYRSAAANGVKLPPPVDSNTLYSEMTQYSQQPPARPPSSMMGPNAGYGALQRPCLCWVFLQREREGRGTAIARGVAQRRRWVAHVEW